MQNIINGNGISSSPYETAAVSMAMDDSELIEWLVQTQHADGSWGGKVAFASDRLLQTMMVVRALISNRQRHDNQDDVAAAISGGTAFISQALAMWHEEALNLADLSGFELLIPTHHRLLREVGVTLPSLPTDILTRYERKMSMLPHGIFYNPYFTNMHHSMEALEGNLTPNDIASMEAVLLPNGSLASSPSATAFLLRQPGVSEIARQRMRTYLEVARNRDGGYSPTVPLDLVIELWQLYFDRLIAPPSLLRSRLLWTLAPLKLEMGVGANALFVADGDDTAVAALLAADFGLDYEAITLADTLIRDFHDVGGHFRTYQLEMTASPTTTAHAAEALATLLRHHLGSTEQQKTWRQALTLVGDYLLEHLWVVDKWHVSRYYSLLKLTAALGAIATLASEVDELNILAQQWPARRSTVRSTLLAAQDPSGGWGDWNAPTIEETAYVSITLLQMPADQQITMALLRARDFLSSSGERGRAEMWIDKTLYQPEGIISSAVQAAQGLLHQTLGGDEHHLSKLKRPPRAQEEQL